MNAKLFFFSSFRWLNCAFPPAAVDVTYPFALTRHAFFFAFSLSHRSLSNLRFVRLTTRFTQLVLPFDCSTLFYFQNVFVLYSLLFVAWNLFYVFILLLVCLCSLAWNFRVNFTSTVSSAQLFRNNLFDFFFLLSLERSMFFFLYSRYGFFCCSFDFARHLEFSTRALYENMPNNFFHFVCLFI